MVFVDRKCLSVSDDSHICLYSVLFGCVVGVSVYLEFSNGMFGRFGEICMLLQQHLIACQCGQMVRSNIDWISGHLREIYYCCCCCISWSVVLYMVCADLKIRF